MIRCPAQARGLWHGFLLTRAHDDFCDLFDLRVVTVRAPCPASLLSPAVTGALASADHNRVPAFGRTLDVSRLHRPGDVGHLFHSPDDLWADAQEHILDDLPVLHAMPEVWNWRERSTRERAVGPPPPGADAAQVIATHHVGSVKEVQVRVDDRWL